MSPSITLSTIDIILISLNSLILLIVIISYFKAHTGHCRGALVTKTKTPDGLVTREAKLSMHEAQHDNIHELQSLRHGRQQHIRILVNKLLKILKMSLFLTSDETYVNHETNKQNLSNSRTKFSNYILPDFFSGFSIQFSIKGCIL